MHNFSELPDEKIEIREVLDVETVEVISKLFREDGGPGTEIEIEFPYSRNFSLFSNRPGRVEIKMDPFNRLVVQVIQFASKRKGFGGRLLNILEKNAREAGCPAVIIESITTEAGYQFALKNGYSMVENPFEGNLFLVRKNKHLDRDYIKIFPKNNKAGG